MNSTLVSVIIKTHFFYKKKNISNETKSSYLTFVLSILYVFLSYYPLEVEPLLFLEIKHVVARSSKVLMFESTQFFMLVVSRRRLVNCSSFFVFQRISNQRILNFNYQISFSSLGNNENISFSYLFLIFRFNIKREIRGGGNRRRSSKSSKVIGEIFFDQGKG